MPPMNLIARNERRERTPRLIIQFPAIKSRIDKLNGGESLLLDQNLVSKNGTWSLRFTTEAHFAIQNTTTKASTYHYTRPFQQNARMLSLAPVGISRLEAALIVNSNGAALPRNLGPQRHLVSIQKTSGSSCRIMEAPSCMPEML
jgi:hypothetical protein